MLEARGSESRHVAKCDKHPESDLDLFCLDHKTLCCTKCKVIEHINCNEVVNISELLDKTSGDDNSLKLDGLKIILNEFIRIQAVCDTLKSDLESQASGIIKKNPNEIVWIE